MSITVRQELQFDTFDPMDIDVSEFASLTESIPQDGIVDLAIASQMAAKFLRAADKCSSILSMLTLYEQKAKDEKRRAYARAVVRAKTAGGKITDNMAKIQAELDDDYIRSCDECNKAEALRIHFKNKHEAFLRGHHLMKDITKGEIKHLKASGFSETAGAGEDSWE